MSDLTKISPILLEFQTLILLLINSDKRYICNLLYSGHQRDTRCKGSSACVGTCSGRSPPCPSGRLACPHWGRGTLLKVAVGESISRWALDMWPGGHTCGSSKLLDSTLCPHLEQQGGAACHLWLCSERNFCACMFNKFCVLLSFSDLTCFWTDLTILDWSLQLWVWFKYHTKKNRQMSWGEPTFLCHHWSCSCNTDLTRFWPDLTILK